MITSVQNARVQHIRALVAERKAREESGEFVVEGVRLGEEALASGWEARLLLYAAGLSPRGLDLVQRCRERGIQVEEAAPHVLKSAAGTETPRASWASLPAVSCPCPSAWISSWWRTGCATLATWARSCAPPLPPGPRPSCSRPAAPIPSHPRC